MNIRNGMRLPKGAKLRVGKLLLVGLLLFAAAFTGSAGMVVFAAPSSGAAPAGEAPAPESVLLLYDSLAKGTADERTLPVVERLLSAFGSSVTPVSLDRYKSGMLEEYPRTILLRNRPDLAPSEEVLAELNQYAGKRFALFGSAAASRTGEGSAADPLATWAESRVSQLPTGADGTLKLANALREWFGVKKEGDVYLLIKEAYPFSDLDLLEEFADRLGEAGIPFLLATRPVFSNTEYPAMLRYLESLKYVQSRGGSILVQTPVVKLAATRADTTLRSKMDGFLDTLMNGGIVPLGVVSEAYWTYDREFAEGGLSFFDSAALLPDVNPVYMERLPSSKAFASSLYTFSPEELPLSELSQANLPTFPVDTALAYDLPETREEMEELLRQLKASWLDYSDYKNEAHTVRTERRIASSADGILTLDGQPVSIDYVPRQVSADFEYATKDPVSFARLFRAQNRFFLVIIVAALIAFVALIGIGRRLYRRKFLK
ncbi:hypothetical protein [Gorillibacterium timonense]|uniref:hypothetical protein n=1 Tax=Gorillibacterium timonense TaxID=1689269 RepID=UPI00071C2912|nr:hypothetical protein [Gorillibacterium timonense]